MVCKPFYLLMASPTWRPSGAQLAPTWRSTGCLPAPEQRPTGYQVALARRRGARRFRASAVELSVPVRVRERDASSRSPFSEDDYEHGHSKLPAAHQFTGGVMTRRTLPGLAPAILATPFGGRGEVYRYLRANYEDLRQLLQTHDPSWTVVAQVLAAAGVRGQRGESPTGKSVPKVWARVVRDVRSAVERNNMGLPPLGRRPKVPNNWKPSGYDEAEPQPAPSAVFAGFAPTPVAQPALAAPVVQHAPDPSPQPAPEGFVEYGGKMVPLVMGGHGKLVPDRYDEKGVWRGFAEEEPFLGDPKNTLHRLRQRIALDGLRMRNGSSRMDRTPSKGMIPGQEKS